MIVSVRVLVVALLVAGHALSAQAQHDVAVRHYGVPHGLPHEEIRAITQAKDGRLWVGTRSGLAFFDGARFRSASDSSRLASAAVTALVPADDRSVWAATWGQGVWRVDASGVQQVVDALSRSFVYGLLMQGDTLLAVTGASLWTVPPGAAPVQEQPFGYRVLPPSQARRADLQTGSGVRDIVAAGGSYWILDERLGPGLWSPGKAPRFLEADLEDWTVLYENEDGVLWALNTATGLHRVNRSEMRLETVLPIHNAYDVATYGGVIHVATHTDVLRWSERSRQALPPLSRHPSLAGINSRRIHGDHEGGLWIGSLNGLAYLPAPDVVHVKEADGRALIHVGSHYTRVPGETWVRTWGSGLLNLRTMQLTAPENHWHWSAMMQSQDGRSHLLGRPGRFVYEEGEWKKVGENHGAVRGSVDAGGRVYLWTDHGLYLDDGEGAPAILYAWPPDERDYHAFTLAPDGSLVLRSGEALLTGRVGAGPSLALDTLAVVPELYEARGRYLLADQVGRVWLALWQDGLLVVENGRATRALVGVNVGSITTTEPGLLTATTGHGIFGFDEATATLRFGLGMQHGLLASTAGGAFFLDDTLVVTHPSGLSLVPRSSLALSTPPPGVILELRQPEGHHRSIEARFFATTYRGPEQIIYQYRLNDEPWQEAAQTALLLTGLPSGTHSLSVRARHPHGAFGMPATQAFTVPTPFYQRAWFVLLAVLLVLAATAGLYQLRMLGVRRRERELVSLVHERTRRLAQEKEKTEEQARRLAELDELKSRFFTDISHEFRTPLTLMMAPLRDLLADESNLPAETRRTVEAPLRSAERLADLVDQILALSRLESGHARLDRRPQDLSALLEDRVSAFRQAARRRDITLTLEAPPAGLVARIDAEAMTRVIDNLLSNALKFTPGSGQVRVELRQAQSHVELRFADTGPGISDEALPHVFERYYRAPGARGTQPAGTGIGLSLAHELVVQHEGAITVESAAGIGTTFTVRLPYEPALQTEDVPAFAEMAGDGHLSGTLSVQVSETRTGECGDGAAAISPDAPYVLIVEDNDAVRAYLVQRLGRQYRVTEAANGEEALAMAREHPPDVILSDVMMPRMDGLALCRAIKADAGLSHTPVLLLTARTAPEQAVEGLEAGADDYVEKPFDSSELIARIDRCIARHATLCERYSQRIVLGPEEVEATSADVAFLERLALVLEERHHESSLSVEDIAFELDVSPRQLRRRVAELTGGTPVRCLREFRLERGAQLLAAQEGTVSEIAYRVGFNDSRVFTRHFKKHFGCSPSQYHAEHSVESEENG